MSLRAVIATPDGPWGAGLSRAAAVAGFEARQTQGPPGAAELAQGPPGLLIVDWALCPVDAKALSDMRARARGWILVLFGSDADLSPGRIPLGLSCGADDILAKSLAEIALRKKMRAWATRLSGEAESSAIADKGLRVDLPRRKVFVLGPRGAWRETGRLTSQEFSLLCLLLRNPGRTLERGFILGSAWSGKFWDVNPETVDRHVMSLRRKLGPQGRRIVTVHGLGYALR